MALCHTLMSSKTTDDNKNGDTDKSDYNDDDDDDNGDMMRDFCCPDLVGKQASAQGGSREHLYSAVEPACLALTLPNTHHLYFATHCTALIFCNTLHYLNAYKASH